MLSISAQCCQQENNIIVKDLSTQKRTKYLLTVSFVSIVIPDEASYYRGTQQQVGWFLLIFVIQQYGMIEWITFRVVRHTR